MEPVRRSVWRMCSVLPFKHDSQILSLTSDTTWATHNSMQALMSDWNKTCGYLWVIQNGCQFLFLSLSWAVPYYYMGLGEHML